MLNSVFNSLVPDIAIDLGSSETVVVRRGQGIVAREASCVAFHKEGALSGKIEAIGNRARELKGKTSANIVNTNPIKGGAIQDFRIAQVLLKHVLQSSCSRSPLSRPRLLMTTPSDATDLEMHTMAEAGTSATDGKAFLVKEMIATVIGTGLPLNTTSAWMVADLGAGHCSTAIVSLHGIMHSRSLRVGGSQFDFRIIDFIRKNYNVLMGEQTAEQLKLELAQATHPSDERSLEVQGHDLARGRPTHLRVTSLDIFKAISETLREISDFLRQALDHTPPEIAGELIDTGLFISGGVALLPGIDTYLSNAIGLPVTLVESPNTVVAHGCEQILANWEKFQHLLYPI